MIDHSGKLHKSRVFSPDRLLYCSIMMNTKIIQKSAVITQNSHLAEATQNQNQSRRFWGETSCKLLNFSQHLLLNLTAICVKSLPIVWDQLW